MAWEILRLKEGEKRFILRGYGFVLHGEVWRGAMKGDVLWGLKALQSPALAPRLLRRWRVYVPQRFGSESNTGRERKYVELLPLASGAPFALRFTEYVPSELIRDLGVAFGGAALKEPENEKPPGTAVEHPSEAAERRGAGRSVEGEDRHPARPRQDPRPKGQVKRRKKRR